MGLIGLAVIVGEIHHQHLFVPVVHWVLTLDGRLQALAEGLITREQFDLLAVAVNTGTNIPSIATPNGQAAFLVPADVRRGAAGEAVVREDVLDGAAVPRDDHYDGGD
ncbi:MAG: hypothetical protein O9284_17040 [Steroidobacteraceae bacterium]|nr:hypothetical protein [Steroidobacteraceae bacterium]